MQQRRSSVQTTPRSGFQKVSPKLESPSIGAPGDAKRSAGKAPGTSTDDSSFAGDAGNAGDARSNARKRAVGKGEKESKTGRRKIKIEFIDDDSRRHITFSKRKAGIMKKAYELATLTGTQILLLVVSQTGLVYTFTTPKLEAIVKQPEGRNLIQECLNAPDPSEGTNGSAQNAPGEMYKEEYNDIVVQEEDGDDEEDDDEEGAEFGRADAGLTAQTFGANPIDVASFAHAGSPQLFHPAWVQMNNPAQDSHAGQQIKRRRTQPNLSPMALHSMPGSEMHNQLYPNPGVSQLPNEQHLMHNALPMYYSSMLGANTPATSTAAHDAIGIPQSHASNLPHGMHHMASVLSEQPNNAAHKH
ncbi:transcription factor of the MADS box [Malassezia vespertilionis]|uniref:transcription factor of the MADS box n=1 Tax=Malassezia vespertilionis TaxID=2020962 RepID=UPI0024B1F839|nr:transcription factor of the MADS box [Malassezia vespertilionis]WFD05881.1 transcription factor of the MADS box [Malassezia vespertilionis]